MTPNEIEVLLHCYCSPQPHPRADAPAVSEALDMFMKHGLIDNNLRTTPRGKATIAMLERVPFARAAWLDENGREVE
jgi:hypothetical protein